MRTSTAYLRRMKGVFKFFKSKPNSFDRRTWRKDVLANHLTIIQPCWENIIFNSKVKPITGEKEKVQIRIFEVRGLKYDYKKVSEIS